MTTERKYFLAGGKDEEVVREFFKSRVAAFTAVRLLGEKFGGRVVFSRSTAVFMDRMHSARLLEYRRASEEYRITEAGRNALARDGGTK